MRLLPTSSAHLFTDVVKNIRIAKGQASGARALISHLEHVGARLEFHITHSNIIQLRIGTDELQAPNPYNVRPERFKA